MSNQDEPVTVDELREAWEAFMEAEDDYATARQILQQAEMEFNVLKDTSRQATPDVWTQFLVWRKEYYG